MKALWIGVSLFALTATAVDAQQNAQPGVAISGQVQPGEYLVFFGFDDASLTPDARQAVADAAAAFEQTGEARVTLRGYADSVGSQEYNLDLSERRAEAVRAELTRLGVPSGDTVTIPEGEADQLVHTADGVPEPANRRVEIVLPEPVVAEEEPVVAAAPAPPPEPAAGPEEEENDPFQVSVGGLYGYNMEDGGESSKSSHLAGVNLGMDFGLGYLASLSLEQAAFYNFFSENDGFGGRSAGGVDLNLGFGDIIPTVGANVGRIYGSGIDDDWFAGPEISLQLPFFDVKLAYDMPFNRDLDDGIVLATIGTGIRF